MKNAAKRRVASVLGGSLGIALIGVCGWYVYTEDARVKENFAAAQREIEGLKTNIGLLTKNQCALQRTRSATQSRTWAKVQEEIEDAVVQVITHVDQINWLQPFKPPAQAIASGSGFLINTDGDILTNYHVISSGRAIYVRIPALGQKRFLVSLRGACPDRDVALLTLPEDVKEQIRAHFGKIPHLTLGDSDSISRTDEIMAVGFPMGCISLQSTLGNISGWERHGSQSFVQLTSPINPGNSGGPAIDAAGHVVGINSAGIVGAQNIGYFIPIAEVRKVLKDLYTTRLVHKPLLGLGANLYPYTAEMRAYLHNPPGGGWFVGRVYPGTPFYKSGVKDLDVIYSINGHDIDMFGDVEVSWSPDAKVSVIDLLNRYGIGDTLSLTIYRKGEKKEISLVLENGYEFPISKKYPGFSSITYEILGGMVVMPLNVQVLSLLIEQEGERAPYLVPYLTPEHQTKGGLVVTHVFADSPLQDAQVKRISRGVIITHVNDLPVTTLEDFRNAVLMALADDSEFLVFSLDEGHCVAIRFSDVIENERRLGARYCYTPTDLFVAIEKEYGKKTT